MCYESFHEVLRVFSNIIVLSGELLTKVGLNKFSLQIGNLLISPIFIGHATRYFFRYSQDVLRVVSKIELQSNLVFYQVILKVIGSISFITIFYFSSSKIILKSPSNEIYLI